MNILKRYAVHFGLSLEYEKWKETREPWLVAPKSHGCDISFHVPMRRSMRKKADWIDISLEFGDRDLWVKNVGKENMVGPLPPKDLLETADWINSSKIFLGTVSCGNAIAEGLGKTRFVEQADGCFNVHVDPPSVSINGMSNEEVVQRVLAEVGKSCEV